MKRSSILLKRNPIANLRVQSHVVGASLMLPRCMADKAKETEVFYNALFGDSTGFKFSASLWPKNLFSRTAQRSLWVPRIAQTHQQIEMGELKQFFHNFGEPECIVGVDCQEQHTSLIVSSESQCNETLPFLVTPYERHAKLFSDADEAPFESQPKQCGVVNWTDLCVGNENERRVAVHIASMFGWHMSVPYKINDEQVYVTCFNGSGGTENRHKISGIIPYQVLLKSMNPPLKSGIPLVFFSCGSEDLVRSRMEKAQELGGKVVMPPLNADGLMGIVQDPTGCPFGLYNRSDEWNEVKPGTKLTWDLISMPAVPFPDPPTAAEEKK